MPQIKEPVSHQFNVIDLKIQEIIFFAKSWILTWIFRQNSRNWIFLLNIYGIFNTSLFIWYISIHHVKYLDKPIKCLEMRAKIKSVWKINEIFLCIFTYIWKLDIFSTYLNFDEKWFLVILNYYSSNVLPIWIFCHQFYTRNVKLKLFDM